MSPSLVHDNGKDEADVLIPPVDFSKEMRGVYAHWMGENGEDELRVADYWRQLGLAVDSLESDGDRFSHMPDMRLLRSGNPWAYCEVKTIQRHPYRIRILHEDRQVEERLESGSTSVEERLETDLVTAMRQLNYVNSDHMLLNFVVLVNRDAESSPELLAELFAKRPPKTRRGLQAKRTASTMYAIQEFRSKVDLCLWVDGLSGFSVTGYFVGSSSLRDQVQGFTGLGLEKMLPLEPAA